jgi:MFS family permease
VRARLGTMFDSLRVRNYRLFATGQLIKLIGIWMAFIAQDWLVLQLTADSATALGLVTALQFAPVLFLTLYGGKLADRFDKRKLLQLANAGMLAVMLVLGVLVTAGVVELWHVFISAAALGVCSAIETPVRQSFVSELVGPKLLPNALSLSAATFNSARIIGPAIAGLLIAVVDTGPVFLITSAGCVATVVGLARMRADELHRSASEPVASRDARIRDGLRYALSRRDLVLPIFLIFVIGLFGFNFQLTLAVLAKTEFRTGAESFGLLSTALAIGALCGALAGTGRRARPSTYVVLTSAMLFGAFETVVGVAPTFALAFLLLLPTGFFMIYFAQAANQRVQLGVDPEYRGRVMALFILVFFGTMPIGAPLIGWTSEQFGPRWGISVGGLVSLLCAVVVAVLQVRRTGSQVRVHLRPLPHVHVSAPAREDSPAVELRVPERFSAGRHGSEETVGPAAR